MAENQHYVPQFLLRHFASGDPQQIHAFDKMSGRTFRTNIRNVAAERGFYDMTIEGLRLTVEPSLSSIESAVAGLVSNIVARRSLGCVSEAEQYLLSVFLAVQFQRGHHLRSAFKTLSEGLREKTRQLGLDPDEVGGAEELNEEDVKRMALGALARIAEMVRLFYEKAWVLLEGPPGEALYIGDNPVTLHNDREFGFIGNLGLSVPGIETYLPLAPTLSLGLFCNSHAEKAGATARKNPTSWASLFLEGIRSGIAVPLGPENVTRLNHYQVMFASRFVYCATGNFDLVRELIAEDPRYRTGVVPKVG